MSRGSVRAFARTLPRARHAGSAMRNHCGARPFPRCIAALTAFDPEP